MSTKKRTALKESEELQIEAANILIQAKEMFYAAKQTKIDAEGALYKAERLKEEASKNWKEASEARDTELYINLVRKYNA